MSQLDDYRHKVDEYIDKMFHLNIGLIAMREEACRRIGQYKTQEGLPVYDPNREKEVLCRVEQRAKEFGLDKEDQDF